MAFDAETFRLRGHSVRDQTQAELRDHLGQFSTSACLALLCDLHKWKHEDLIELPPVALDNIRRFALYALLCLTLDRLDGETQPEE